MVPYDVQLIGGIVLHQGKIAEMATGEGKPLGATLPLYLNALAGRGAHLVTVNNYLARRDSQWMGHLFTWLGLTVGCIDETEPSTPERRAAYLCDITYGTNNEFGFDYLRDNMVFTLEQRVQRSHAYAIIDEVDSILIDEARTPLIISGAVGSEADEKYAQFNAQVVQLVRKQTAVVNDLIAKAEPLLADEKAAYQGAVLLYQAQLGMPKNKKLLKLLQEPGVKAQVQRVELDVLADRKLPAREQKMRHVEEDLYFVLDERGHSVHLTDKGVETMSPQDPDLFVVPDISHAVHEIERDESLSPKEKIERRRQVEADYAMKSETLHIIHKLLQAHALYEREVDYVVQEGKVLIVDEFTGRLMHGRRWSEGLHQAVEAKEGVAVQEESQTLATITIQNYFRMYDKLAGMTGTAETEETEFFQIYGLEVVVIPTNRPVRRVDKHDLIYKTRSEKYKAILDEVERADLPPEEIKRLACNDDPPCGLVIVGTERHEARRIDRQLRGRSGRQGDPGQSVFFLSLEDDLMRLFGSDRIARIMDRTGSEENEVITHPWVTAAIGQAQKRVELQNFQSRKKLLEYDDVMNQQREVIYALRLFALEGGEELKAEALRMVEQAVAELADELIGNTKDAYQWDRALIETEFLLKFLVSVPGVTDAAKIRSRDELVQAAQRASREAFQAKLDHFKEIEAKVGAVNIGGQALSHVMLGVIDEKWKDHLYDLDQLKAAIHYRQWGQRDPLIEYKREGYEMFVGLMRDVHATFAERWLKLQIEIGPPPQRGAPSGPGGRPPASSASGPGAGLVKGPSPRRPAPMVASKPAVDGLVSGDPAVASQPSPVGAGVAPNPYAGIGRNDPCPCGSGKKFKKCHGAGL